ncbi:MAG: hypothetical protein JO069_22195 [Verrucomicrobia bacterium]|nr:hypothetical protein [Verrucomicrobiota bacterium]
MPAASKLVWDKIAEPALASALVSDELAALASEVGLPRIRDAETPRQDAEGLLRIGAEVEHALLIQYLYAAYSLDPAVSAGSDWQFLLLDVARQEMAHLITVQNLLLAIGAKPHFERDPFPQDSPLFPFPLRLEPLSRHSIAKYLAAEMPLLDRLPRDERDETVRILSQNGISVKPGQPGFAVHRVGLIYAKLRNLFQAGDVPINGPDGDFRADWHLHDGDFVSTLEFAKVYADPREWGVVDSGMHVDSAIPRNAALMAIDFITEQGEGMALRSGSHFERFLGLYEEFAANAAGAQAVRTSASDPATQSSRSGKRITAAQTLPWAKLLNLRYGILLLCLYHALSEPRSSDPDAPRNLLLRWAVFEEMNPVIRSLSMALTAMPLADGGAERAGPPFELPASFPESDPERWRLHEMLIAESAEIVRQIGLDNDLGYVLHTIVANDSQRRPYLQDRLAAPRG